MINFQFSTVTDASFSKPNRFLNPILSLQSTLRNTKKNKCNLQRQFQIKNTWFKKCSTILKKLPTTTFPESSFLRGETRNRTFEKSTFNENKAL